MKRFLTLALIVVLTVVLRAQDQATTANITSTTCPGTGCVTLLLSGGGSGVVQVTGTYVGTILVEASANQTVFVTLTTFNANEIGTRTFGAAGYRAVRARATAFTSGTATVTIRVGASSQVVAVTNFPATQPVSGTVAVSNLPGTQPVSGTVAVSNFPATQPVSGTVTANAGTGTLAVSVASLPLPTGASTSANQTTANTSLSNIDTKMPALGQAAMSASQPVAIASNQSAVPVSGTFWQATQPVSGTFWQATQPISGTVTANAGSGTLAVSGPLTDTQLRATPVPISGTFWQATQPVSGTVTTTPPANATTNVAQVNGVTPLMGNGTTGTGSLRVTMASDTTMPSTPVTGTFWQATQPISGTVTTTPPANASTNVAQFGGTNISTGTGTGGAGIPRVTVSSDSFPATQPVSGTVTTTPPANASSNVAQINGVTPLMGNGTTGTGSLRVTVASDTTMPSTPVTGPLTDTQLRASAVPVSQGAGGSGASTSWYAKITDDSFNLARVKAASTPAAATDPALVVTLSPNSPPPMFASGVGARVTGTITSTTCPGTGCVSITPNYNYGVATVTINGTYSLTPIFEFSDDGGSYYALTCTRSDTNVQESSAGALVNTVRAWDCSVYGTSNFRVRATAFVSGSANIGITLSTAAVEAAPTVALATTGNTVAGPTLTKGTQGATGFAVQPLTDSGRTAISFYANNVASGATTVETLITWTQSKGTAATSATASYTITNGKTLRITALSVGSRGNAAATIQSTVFNLRMNTGGACVVTSTPILFAAQSATPATASAWDRVIIPIPEGYEIAGNGTIAICISAAATFTTNAPTWAVNLIGYEY